MNDKLIKDSVDAGSLYETCLQNAKTVICGARNPFGGGPILNEAMQERVIAQARSDYEYLTKPADPLKDFDLDSNKAAMPETFLFASYGSKSDGPDLNALRREVFTTIGAQNAFDSIEVVKMMGESAQENMFRDLCQVDLQICEKDTENLHYDGETMTKVFRAIRDSYGCVRENCECCDQDATEAISALQNAGILFREHEKLFGANVIVDEAQEMGTATLKSANMSVGFKFDEPAAQEAVSMPEGADAVKPGSVITVENGSPGVSVQMRVDEIVDNLITKATLLAVEISSKLMTEDDHLAAEGKD